MTVKKYRKKPVVIEAVQYAVDASNKVEVLAFCGGSNPIADDIDISTIEGRMRARRGDYIIKGVAGEFYPCKPDIFDATYEPVEG